MTHSLRRDRKVKAIAEALAMLADAQPPLAPHLRRPVLETEDWLFESATAFCAALEKYAERGKLQSRLKTMPGRSRMW